ncbi:MAG: electron transfer flavoprotein subunit alpha/FixB family protein, partial [Candidatus Bathyarchaeia archaeon]
RILAVCKCEKTRPQMVTVRPGTFKTPTPNANRQGRVERISVNLSPSDVRSEVLEQNLHGTVDITKADCVVIAGAGTGGDLTLVKRLAGLLHGEVGVTRPLADKMIVSRDLQVGSTGYSVRPKLVIVAGASGAAHFVSGIEGAEVVVAINNDPDVPIFDYADYCIVDDLFKVLPALIAQLEKTKVEARTVG